MNLDAMSIVIFYNKNNMGDKWYNSRLAEGVSIGVILLSVAFGIGPCMRGCNEFMPSPQTI